MFEAKISPVEPKWVLPLFGPCDRHLRTISDTLGVEVTHHDGEIRVAGEETAVALATDILEQLKSLVQRQGEVEADEVSNIISQVTGGESYASNQPIDIVQSVHQVRPRTPGQVRYIEAMRSHDLVFAIGPAGTGKTYLAVAIAVEALKHSDIRKIVLVRPAVEAGESLGFLPGDLQAKINPYLRPLLDALNEMIDYDQIKRFMDLDVIEVVPLAYMRGRTLNEAFIILDEAQNTTVSQMQMFLTRMGADSKVVVSGDITQVDLAKHTKNGLEDALVRLRNIEGVANVQLTKADIVRHRLVQDIVLAYDEEPKKRR